MSAVYVSNLIINTGATFSQSFDLLNNDGSGPLDLTDFTATAQFELVSKISKYCCDVVSSFKSCISLIPL